MQALCFDTKDLNLGEGMTKMITERLISLD
jgi:hypothetical protein